MQAKREKGLCFNCDEKFSAGHRCKGRMSLLLLEGELDDSVVAEVLDSAPTISLHAFLGDDSPHTMRLKSIVNGKAICILIDGGSTHNFIQAQVASYLGLTITQSKHFTVQVGNGQSLSCVGLCSPVPVTMQQHSFTIDLFVIHLQGADIVLGVQWLQLLGPVTTDYKALTMDFCWQDQPVRLKAEVDASINHITPSSLRKLSTTGRVLTCFQLMSFCPTPADELTQPSVDDAEIAAILLQFPQAFADHNCLPPSRPTDHHILLTPNTLPINIKPYRYPYYQKIEIERLVSKMLDARLIQHNTSAFSSLVILVKKKGWHVVFLCELQRTQCGND
ncbi:RVP_2 domain-containing protein [Cephalotus follicularis]|uniref:RVP_2 domain-containing protein n=1 Tax=Cephalotus follicularis TaxID=3775 RepID=A0A1Q3AP78_CEPFO|nr:RVP_2 domain-containing protein [Cephalotus follicularis]